MGKVHVTYFTDPFCPWCWTVEPHLRRLEVEFGDQVSVTFVIVGLAEQLDSEKAREIAISTVEASARSAMPADPRIYLTSPPSSTYPAALAVCAVAEQRDPADYLRRLREAIFLERRPMDRPEALVDVAREVRTTPSIDLDRLRRDMESDTVAAAFARHREKARAVPSSHHQEGTGRVQIPSIQVEGGPPVYGLAPYEEWRDAVVAAGGVVSHERPPVEALLQTGRRTTVPEVAQACHLPRHRTEVELWRLVADWRARPEAILFSYTFRAG
jgi:predicted DsbA family dithiol-disulfide isomerase